MARSVADLVLVRDDFAVVPGMVAEGRQILRNIQRVARLFITKAVFTASSAWRSRSRQAPSRCFRASSRSPLPSRSASQPLCSRLRPAPDRGGQNATYSRSPASRSQPGSRSGSESCAGYMLSRYGFGPRPDPLAHGRHRDRRRLRARGRDPARDRGRATPARRRRTVRADGAAVRARADHPVPAELLRARNPHRRRCGRLGARHHTRNRKDARRPMATTGVNDQVAANRAGSHETAALGGRSRVTMRPSARHLARGNAGLGLCAGRSPARRHFGNRPHRRTPDVVSDRSAAFVAAIAGVAGVLPCQPDPRRAASTSGSRSRGRAATLVDTRLAAGPVSTGVSESPTSYSVPYAPASAQTMTVPSSGGLAVRKQATRQQLKATLLLSRRRSSQCLLDSR